MDDQKKPLPLTDAVEPEFEADSWEETPLEDADAIGQTMALLEDDEEEEETDETEESDDSDEEEADDDGEGDEVAFTVTLRVIAWIPGRYPIM